MSFDPRSRQRLEALGRTLPQKLPAPQPPSPVVEPSPRAGRHRLETEQDPDALFHELITASSDGSVPSHLLDRLRELEARQPRQPLDQAGAAGVAASRSLSGSRTGGSADPAGAKAGTKAGASPRRNQGGRVTPPRTAGQDPEQRALYSAFDEMLRDADPDA